MRDDNAACLINSGAPVIDPTMWSQILLNNSEDILKQLAEFQAELKEVVREIAAGDEAALYDFFQKAKISRDRLGPDQVGAAPG